MADGPSDVEALLTVPPDEFVAARNALVKSLRGAGRKDDAAAVAALRRPSVVDWALNTVASESPDVVGTVSHAASRLRQAQAAVLGEAEGGDASDLRESMGVVRAATGELRAAAEKVLRRAGRPASDLGALSARVNQVSVSEALLDQLGHSRLGTAAVDADVNDDPFAAMSQTAPAPRRQRTAKKTATRATKSTKATGAKEAAAADADRRRDRQHAAEAAAARRARERARVAATKAVDAARRTLARLERQAQEADGRLSAAQDAAERAYQQADAARAELEGAERTLADLD
jgi:chromosome segregation ATPase